ncbi:MAG: TlpA family protein disulfide reductase [Gemmobacter sp.]|nr:TlpA family protein disulfide reductase [Gemmobacter sp.]
MLSVRAAVLYTALLLGANPVAADVAAADAARAGDMRKLNFAPAVAVPEIGLIGMDDAPRSLAEFRGEWVVLNFWATWCPPCRTEMPSLGALQKVLGADGVEVVTVATGRNAVPAITEFFREAGVEHLIALRDPKSALAHEMGIAGLPVTVILNPDGEEVARLIGDADWSAPEARAVFAALMR